MFFFSHSNTMSLKLIILLFGIIIDIITMVVTTGIKPRSKSPLHLFQLFSSVNIYNLIVGEAFMPIYIALGEKIGLEDTFL